MNNEKIALASSDGKVVNQHFGKADRFYIVTYDKNKKIISLLEERKTVPICHNGDHDDNDLQRTAESLSDCKYVLVSRIGIRACAELEKKNIRAFELPGIISESLDKMYNYLEIEKLFKR